MGKLQVGAAKAVITPTKEELQKLCEGAEGMSAARFEDIHDDCHVKAIVIDNSETKTVIVSFDLGGMYEPEELRESLSRQLMIPKENVVITATHNHTGLMPFNVNGLYAGFMNKVNILASQVVEKADQNKRPAKYGFGTGESYINANRDLNFEDGSWMVGRNMKGFSDKTLAVLKFVDEDNKLIAAVLNHGTHATYGMFAPDIDGKIKMSANFPGICCDYVEQRFGNDAVVLWTSGAAGNQAPLLKGMRLFEPDGYATLSNTPPGCEYLFMEHTGQTHAVDAIEILNKIDRYKSSMKLSFSAKAVMLPGQKAPEGYDRDYNRTLVDKLRTGNRAGIKERPVGEIAKMLDDPENPQKLEMQLALLGDVAIVGCAAEIYAEIGKKLKEASPFKNTVVMTHTGKSLGYILDASTLEKENFHPFTSFGNVKAGVCDDLIVNNMLDMFDEVL